MQYLTTVLLGASLAAAAPMSMIQRSPLAASMTPAEVAASLKTCWGGKIKAPSSDTPAPCADKTAQQLSLFPIPSAKPNMLTVHNYCSYDIKYVILGPKMPTPENAVLTAGSSIDRNFNGNVFKASTVAGKELLIEYNVAADGKLWYDMSMITCLGKTGDLLNSNTSACPGHEAGLQLGNKKTISFQCGPGVWCDDQAYLYEENLCKKQNPVSQCAPTDGLVMEFCAKNKK